MAFTNYAIDRSDLLIAIGMRFDDRVTGRLSSFAPNARVIHIDIDPAEIGKNVRVTVPIIGDAKDVLELLIDATEPVTHEDWLKEIRDLRQRHPSDRVKISDKLLPQYVIQELSDITNGKSIVVTGVGQHQMWAAQHYTYVEPNSWITSGGLGTMGFEIPAAIGASVARPDTPVWSIAGDGGFQMTMSELATIVENKIPVKIAIINNNSLGLVRQLQDLFYDKVRVAVGYTGNPDFVKLADAYGIWATRVTDRSGVGTAITEAMGVQGPAIIDFRVADDENVYPHLPAGESVAEMIEDPTVERERLWAK
jgi:acetolactate synthase-1/2/3 large subunit